MLSARCIEILDDDAESRQELDRNFLRTGYRRRLYAATSDAFVWRGRPTRARTPLTLIPIALRRNAVIAIRYVDAEGRVQCAELQPGRYYYVPPGLAYRLEASGTGALEVFSPVLPDGRLFDEECLPDDFFEATATPGDLPIEQRMVTAMESETRKPRKVDVLIINDEAETPSFLNPMSGNIFVSNPVGKRLMELADGSRTLNQITEDLSREFKGAAQAEMLADAGEFFAQATKKGLVTWME